MSEERFTEILEKDYPFYEGDGIWGGLQIIKKYLPESDCIQGAEHDMIFACDVDEICGLITEEDAVKLGEFMWSAEDGILCHFV